MSTSHSTPPEAPAPEFAPAGRTIPGKMAIIVIAVLALVAAGGNFWYQREQMRRPLECWGSTAVALFLRSPGTEIWRLEPAAEPLPAVSGDPTRGDEPLEVVRLGQAAWRVAERRTLTRARGFSNVRRALAQGATFAWDQAPQPLDEAPAAALAFFDARDRAVVLVSAGGDTIWLAGDERGARLRPEAAAVFAQFCRDELSAPLRVAP